MNSYLILVIQNQKIEGKSFYLLPKNPLSKVGVKIQKIIFYMALNQKQKWSYRKCLNDDQYMEQRIHDLST